MIIVVGIFLAITTGAAIEYYKLLRKAKEEYTKAKTAIEDIVLSFNRQLKRETEKLDLVAYKVEAIYSKSDKAMKKIEEADKKTLNLENRINFALEDREKMLLRLDEIDKKTRDVITSQEAIAAKITAIEEQTRQLPMIPDSKIEAVIPIRREKALAPLTETELSVLEMLSVEGFKTAPEIKDKIKLSREHTARLMKKLYEGGYLERDTSKIPFKYSVKKEMEKLLKKSVSETAAST